MPPREWRFRVATVFLRLGSVEDNDHCVANLHDDPELNFRN